MSIERCKGTCSNYHVSVKFVFHSEKKLRLSSLIDCSESLDELTHDLDLFNSANISINKHGKRNFEICIRNF